MNPAETVSIYPLKNGLKSKRLEMLNETAINQLKSLLVNNSIKHLKIKGNVPIIDIKTDDN